MHPTAGEYSRKLGRGNVKTPLSERSLADQPAHKYCRGNVGMTVAAVLAPGKRPFTVGKPAKVLDINDFHFSSGPLNERLLGETAQQHGITLTGVLQSCGGCLEAKGVRGGVPRRTTLRAGRPMETAHTDLAGPYEASMGGSLYLIMFVDSCLLYTSPSPRDQRGSRMPSSA